MFGLWLSFFRENCASFVALFVLLPATVFVNWRLGQPAHRAGGGVLLLHQLTCCTRPWPCRTRWSS